MALSPEAMRDNPAAPIDPNNPPPQRNSSGFFDPMPGPALDETIIEGEGAPRYWALYPFPPDFHEQTLPAGMWAYESPVSKGLRARDGDDPHVAPREYQRVIDEAIRFPFGIPEEIEAAREEGRAQRPETEAERRARPPNVPNTPAATQL